MINKIKTGIILKITALHLHMLKTAVLLSVIPLTLGVTYNTQHFSGVHQKIPIKLQAVNDGITHHKAPVLKPKPTSHPSPTPTIAPPSPQPAAVVPRQTPVTTAGPKPQPVIVPSPSSSVSNLAPTPSAPASGTPSSTSTPSSPPSSGSQTTTSYTSTNWSGYLATSGLYSAVSGSWTVPAPTGNGSTTSADATWIGIGGVTSSDLIQVGTDNTVSPSGSVYTEAFYELLPGASRSVPGVTVTAGDSMTASLNEVSSGQWTIHITDATTSKSYTSTVAYNSSQSSVEWIEEDPSYTNGSQVPFDNFGTTSITSGAATTGGSNLTIKDAGSQLITMVGSNGQPIATPSAIGNDGASFSVTRNGRN